MKKTLYILCFLSAIYVEAYEHKASLLYRTLDPSSAVQQLAYYELFPCTKQGHNALLRGITLLGGSETPISEHSLEGILSLIQKLPDQEMPSLDTSQLDAIDQLANGLLNRKLRGFRAATAEQLLDLPPEEIDIARGVILSQIEEDEDAEMKIRGYEAVLDLIALQIGSKLPNNAAPKEKIRAISTFIFDTMGFRFPPHSKHVKNIDLYTFLPSVLDSRQGVCLGVSILYLSIAQRLGLALEAVTPPGHIFIRYRNGEEVINIETTARGIHVETEEYLGIDTRSLQTRNFKEVVGLEHINNASTYLKKEDYQGALTCYKRSLPFLGNDQQVMELIGLCHLFCGRIEEGNESLKKIKDSYPEYAVSKNTMMEDYFSGAVGVDGIRAVMLPVDETRESILKKKEALEHAIELYPQFREGWQSLAIAWLQLNRAKEGLSILEHYHTLDPNNATAEYYLSALYLSRFNDRKAWEHLRYAEELTRKRNHTPKALKQLRRQLATQFPE